MLIDLIFLSECIKLVNTLATITLLNTVETIPIERVAAKPFIGPVPNQNSISAVIKVVMFASRIVHSDLP
jgi:hypothetical protein